MKSTNPKTDALPAAPPRKPAAPIDISKAKSKARSAKLSADSSTSPEATPDGEPQSSFTLRQRRFLQLLREGNNITMGCAIIGITRHGYHQWRRRKEGFRAAVAAAREVHRQEVACAFHDADAYARSLIDMVQRDQSLPATVRLRAANQLLRRPGQKDWLPSPLPEDLDPEDPANDAPLDLPGFPHFADEILPESATILPSLAPDDLSQEPESAQAEAESGDVPSQSASAVAGGNLADLSAPKAAEPLPSEALAHPHHPTPNAYNAYIPEAQAQADNPPQNQQYPAIPPSPASASQIENYAYNAYSATPSQPGPGASAASASPCPGPSPSLTETWLNRTFLQAHESPKAFEKFLTNHIRTYAPASAPEELLVFRITQKAWLLRRIETWERAITDSRVAKIREKHPNAAAPACIAMSLLEVKESNQTRFYERTAKLRKEHEDALDRLTARLDTLQLRRETNTRRVKQRPFSLQQLTASETAFSSTPIRSTGEAISPYLEPRR